MTSLARRLNVDLPICSAVDGVLNHFNDIDASINTLLLRPLKLETA
jgi:glycerol-3-phosphate dehydrogenase (NAD(P)+)